MAWTTPPTWSNGQDWGGSQVNQFARDNMNALTLRVARTRDTSSTTGSISTTAVDINGASVTFSAIDGYRYRIEWQLLCRSTVDGDAMQIRMVQGASSNIGDTNFSQNGASVYRTTSGWAEIDAAATGSITVKLQARIIGAGGGGPGTMNVLTSGVSPILLTVDRVGETP